MKKSILCCLFLFSCSDNHSVGKEDLYKFPRAKPFVFEAKDFTGVYNIDLSILRFSYTPKKRTNVIVRLDSIASSSNWKIKKLSPTQRLYTTHAEDMAIKQVDDSLKVNFDQEENRLYFVWK